MKLFASKYFLPAMICSGCFMIFSLWILYVSVDHHSRQIKARQRLSLNIAESFIVFSKLLVEEHHDNPGRVNQIFETLQETSESINYISLSDTKGKHIASAGYCAHLDNGAKFSHGKNFIKHEDSVIIRKNFPSGTGKPDYTITISVDTSSCFAASDARSNLPKITFIAGSAIFALAFIIWSQFIRIHELGSRLLAEKRKSEFVDELGLAATGLAHETKNPLGVIRGLAQNIADNSKVSVSVRTKAREIMEETDVTTARLGDFLSYARLRKPSPSPIDAQEFITRIAGLLDDDFKNAGIKLVHTVDVPCVMADKDMLSQMLMNLLTNSLKFTPENGRVEILLTPSGGARATLSVKDNGKGIPAAILPNVFKPYVSGTPEGYGIGLAIVKRIAEQSGWKIKLLSKLDSGTEVTIAGIEVPGQIE
ncbi:MAG: HAMP domain-containing histidine kinase [Victivallales bacterium]|nr:HAMP domain-containing histidine kinase [Victivallales bacterium]